MELTARVLTVRRLERRIEKGTCYPLWTDTFDKRRDGVIGAQECERDSQI